MSAETAAPVVRPFFGRLSDADAVGRSNAITVTSLERTTAAVADRPVTRDDTTDRVRSRYATTPRWPPSSLFVGYRLRSTDAVEAAPVCPSLPVADDTVTTLLTAEPSLSSTSETHRVVSTERPLLVGVTSVWEIIFQ